MQDDFIANVVLARQLVNPSCRGSVGNVEARLGERAGCPDVNKGSTTTVGHPQAWILPVPAALYVGIGGVIIVIDLLPNFAIFLHGCARLNGAVPTKEAHIVHE